MNRSRTRWLIAPLIALGIFGASAGLSMYRGFTGQFDDSLSLVGNTGHGVIVSTIAAALALGLCVGSIRGSRRSSARRTRERSANAVAHVQATLYRRD